MSAPTAYKRVSVAPGKHGNGDFRVSIGGISPTHGELLAMLWWVFRAEDRYKQNNPENFGRRLLWWHVLRVYHEDAELLDILHDADGSEVAA